MRSKRSFLSRSSFKTFVENQNYFNFWTDCLFSLPFVSTYSLILWVGNITWTGSIKIGCGGWKLMKTSRAFCLSRNLVKRPTKAWEEGESLTSPLLKPTSTVSLDRVTKKASGLTRLSVSRPVKGYYWVLNLPSRFMPVGILSELQKKKILLFS